MNIQNSHGSTFWEKSITWISVNFLKFLNQSLSFKTSVNSSLLGKINAWFTLVISGQRYFSPQAKYIKSSHWRCSVKKVFSKFRKFHRKTVLESLFDKFPGPYAWSFIKKRLQHTFRAYANDCFYSRSSSSYYSRGPLKVHNSACTFIKIENMVRSSRLEKFFKIGVLKNFAIFTEKRLYWSLY